MSTRFKAISVLESYSPEEFADFLSKNGFPKCKQYIVLNKVTYSKFKGYHEFQVRKWKNFIDFVDINDFCKFHRELQISPEDFFPDIVHIKSNIVRQQSEQKNNIIPVRKPIPSNKPFIATQSIRVIKPGLPKKPNIKPKIINDHEVLKSENPLRSSSLEEHDNTTDQNKVPINKADSYSKIREELITKLNNKKNLPIPPKEVNIKTAPNLPHDFPYNSNPADRKSSSDEVFDFDTDDEKEENDRGYEEMEEKTVHNVAPDEDICDKSGIDEDDIYCEANDVLEEQCSPVSVLPHLPVPPNIDRQRMPKPTFPMHIAQPQPDRQPYQGRNKPTTMPIAQHSESEDDDDNVHVYEELPPSPEQPHAKENTYSMDPTQRFKHDARSVGSCEDEDYLEPRRAIPPIQHTEQSRPLPPTPAQAYTLDHLRNETYFRDIDRKSAEKILQTEPIGAFLVRPSKKFFCCFTIKGASKIFNVGTLKTDANKFHFNSSDPDDCVPFHSMTDMINYYIENGISIPDDESRVTHVNLLNILRPIR